MLEHVILQPLKKPLYKTFFSENGKETAISLNAPVTSASLLRSLICIAIALNTYNALLPNVVSLSKLDTQDGT